MSTTDRPWVVMKFGGTSVAGPENWKAIADLVRKNLDEGLRCLVVHSALAGVSNALEALPKQALNGEGKKAVEDIKERHRAFARRADLDADYLLEAYFSRIDEIIAGISLIREASERLCAELMAMGELMASRLGLELLKRHDLNLEWLDARTALTTSDTATHTQVWLDSTVEEASDTTLIDQLDAFNVVLTQGFIASNRHGETVLLGRGGSDTSAAWFAARMNAVRLEIWTDVPGLFSADPRLTTGARLLKALSYEEAQEIASMGGKVLHPRCIGPARNAGIPILVKDTFRPDLPGTHISAHPADDTPQLKAVSLKSGVRMVVMEGSGMWRQVGFLADVFACFKQCGLSVDQVSTSETNVTATLDPDPTVNTARLEQLRVLLSEYCRVRIIEQQAVVSLIGYGIRRVLHRLAPALEIFQDRPIRLVGQAANDLNFTVVVDESEGRALAVRLHDALIGSQPESAVFGSSWAELATPSVSKDIAHTPWWIEHREALLNKAPKEGGRYVYHLPSIRQNAASVAGLSGIDRAWYAIKANPDPEILAEVHAAGMGFECVSMGEVNHVRKHFPNIDPADILFTPNFAPRSEYEAAVELGVHLTLDGLHPLVEWPEIFRDTSVLLRFNPDRPRGHHRHVRTAGPGAKFGIPREEVHQALNAARDAGARVAGLHAHAGSGIMEADHWREIGTILADLAAVFPEARILNVGGGLGVPDNPFETRFNLDELDQNLATLRRAFPDYELWLEPGRFIVAEAGVLLTRVTQIKTAQGTRFVGAGTGMNSLIRPALYGARHEIVNLSRWTEPPSGLASIVGPICESADLLGSERLLPETTEGDVLLIAGAGAYGAVMSSHYNLREPADEIVIA